MARESLGWSDLLGLGGVVAVLVVGGLALGWWLDSLLNTAPVLLLVGLALGLIAGISYTVIQFKTYLQQ